MSRKYPLLIILKPEIFDPAIRLDHAEIFLPRVGFPSSEVFLGDLLEGITSEYVGPFSIIWKEEEIRAQYNQPHHFLFEPGFPKNRVDTLVEIFSNKRVNFYIAYGVDDDPKMLTNRKKEIRRKFLRDPDISFYSLYHVSDTFEDAAREIAIYQKYIDGIV